MRNLLLVALACYTTQDLQTAYLTGRREGICHKHCLAQGKTSIYDRKKKKCLCAEPQDEDDVYKPAIILSMPLQHVTVTGGSRSDNDPPETSSDSGVENKTLIPVFNSMILR